MSVMRRALLLLSLAAGTAAAQPAFLATTGTRIDGRGIAGIERPRVMDDGTVFFRAPDTRIGVGLQSFATGDSLPAPLRGSIERVVRGASAGTTGAVVLSATGPDVATAIFLAEPVGVTSLVTIAAGATEELKDVVVNRRGDIAYLTRSRALYDLHVRLRATGVSIRIAAVESNLLKRGALVIDERGRVAWMSRQGLVYYWDEEQGTRYVGGDGYPWRRTKAAPLAIHETFGVAFVSRYDAISWSPQDATSRVLVHGGSHTGDLQLVRLYGDIGFAAQGQVVVGIRAKRSTARYACIDGSAVTACNTPKRASASTVQSPVTHSAIFRADAAGVRAIVTPDRPFADGTLRDIIDYVVSGATVTFSGHLEDGRNAVGRWTDDRVRPMVIDGQPAGSRKLALSGSLYDGSRAVVAIGGTRVDKDGASEEASLGLLLVHRDGSVATVRRARREPFRSLSTEDAAVAVAGQQLIVLTESELLTLRNGQLAPLLPHDPSGEDGFSQIGLLATAGTRVLFTAMETQGALGIYEHHHSTPRRVVELPTLPTGLAAAGQDVLAAFRVPTPDGLGSVGQLRLIRDSVAAVIASEGDTLQGQTVMSIGDFALARTKIAWVARLSGDGPRHALVSIDRRE